MAGDEGASQARCGALLQGVGSIVVGTTEDRRRDVEEPFMSAENRGRELGVPHMKRMVEIVDGEVVEIDGDVGRAARTEPIVPRKQAIPARGKRRKRAETRE